MIDPSLREFAHKALTLVDEGNVQGIMDLLRKYEGYPWYTVVVLKFKDAIVKATLQITEIKDDYDFKSWTEVYFLLNKQPGAYTVSRHIEKLMLAYQEKKNANA